MIPPLLNYYGAKHFTSARYPAPEFRTIVEPFAGGAGYASRYHDRNVILVEKYGRLAAVWRYLIGASESEILALPILAPGETLDDYRWPCAEAHDLVGWMVNTAIVAPCNRLSAWAISTGSGRERDDSGMSFWSEARRARTAATVRKIRHWQIIEGDYTDAPDIEATWFIDPPYVGAGKHYKHGSAGIDYAALGDWCRNRRGQVIVCEATGADWLPFEPVRFGRSAQEGRGSTEAIWTRHADPLGALGMASGGRR